MKTDVLGINWDYKLDKPSCFQDLCRNINSDHPLKVFSRSRWWLLPKLRICTTTCMLPVVSLVMMMWWYGFETNFWKCHRRSRQSRRKIGGCFLGEGWKETTSFHRCQKGSWYGFETIMKSIHDVNEKCSFTALGWLLCKCSWSWLSYEAFPPDLPTFCSLQVWVKYVSRPFSL